MSKTLSTLRQLPYVAHVDDERNSDNSIIVTLATGYCFVDEPGCGVRGFDTVREAQAGCSKTKVYAAEAADSQQDAPAGAAARICELLPPKTKRVLIQQLSQPAGTRLPIDWYDRRDSNFDRKSREPVRDAAEAAGFVEYRGGHPWVTESGNEWALQQKSGAA